MSEAIQDIVNPAIIGSWGLFNQLLDGIAGLRNYLFYIIMIFMVFRFILAPVLRIHLGRIQGEIAAGSDKVTKKKKPVDKRPWTKDRRDHMRQKEKYKER